MIEGSIADLSGSIMVNDQITEVNGTSLSGRSNQEAVDILKLTGNVVHLTIVRYLRGLKFEELQDGIKAANVPTPTSPATSARVTPVRVITDCNEIALTGPTSSIPVMVRIDHLIKNLQLSPLGYKVAAPSLLVFV